LNTWSSETYQAYQFSLLRLSFIQPTASWIHCARILNWVIKSPCSCHFLLNFKPPWKTSPKNKVNHVHLLFYVLILCQSFHPTAHCACNSDDVIMELDSIPGLVHPVYVLTLKLAQQRIQQVLVGCFILEE
jgi:hypothetical protein